MNIEGLRETLRNNVITVTFIKKNGDLREMLCTTMDDFIPPVSGNSTPSDSLVTVWDIESDAWRSFHFDSIQSIFMD